MNKAKYFSFASAVSTLDQSDIFISVKLRILEAPKANLNGARVTEAFIDDIVANEARYNGLPLYADKKALLSGKYNHLGHMYNQKTGEFYSTQIGSFYQFEKESFEGGCYLIGYARIPKRDKNLRKALCDLFADNSLKFSFEIACQDFKELDDGTIEIDASENNYLEGTALVTFPACEDAVALEFVAQRKAESTEGGDTEMAEVEKLENETSTAETQEEVQLKAEENVEAPVVETPVAETEEAGQKEENAEGTQEPEKSENAETAAVHIESTKTVVENVYAYDDETGKSAFQRVEVTSGSSDSMDGNLVETEEGLRVAEAGGDETPAETSGASGEDTPGNTADNLLGDPAGSPTLESSVADDVPRIENDDEKKKTAELIAELTKTVNSLVEEIKSLKEQKVTASVQKLNAAAEAINPFVDSMKTAGNNWNDLLQPVDQTSGYRDLLSK